MQLIDLIQARCKANDARRAAAALAYRYEDAKRNGYYTCAMLRDIQAAVREAEQAVVAADDRARKVEDAYEAMKDQAEDQRRFNSVAIDHMPYGC